MSVPGVWETDFAVLRLGGSVVEDHGDHLVVRTPHNPGYHWGNFVVVTDPLAASHAERWIETFDEHFPDAAHLAVGLPGEPERGPWAAHDVAVEVELVLAAGSPTPTRVTPDGYAIHAFTTPEHWARAVELDLREPTAAGPGESFRGFLERQAATRAELVRRGVAAFFGAVTPEDELVAQLGIVLCGPLGSSAQVARFQHVGTHEAHRGRGVASHLLGVAGGWAGERGADRWEIHVDPGSVAHRLYSALGFAPRGTLWQAVRVP